MLLWSYFIGKTNFAVRPQYLGDYKKNYRQSQLRSGEIAKKQNVGYLPT